MQQYRSIIHVDLDAYYASIEQRDQPELRGRPVIVGGDPHKRGVVSTCSGRRAGIRHSFSHAHADSLQPVPPGHLSSASL